MNTAHNQSRGILCATAIKELGARVVWERGGVAQRTPCARWGGAREEAAWIPARPLRRYSTLPTSTHLPQRTPTGVASRWTRSGGGGPHLASWMVGLIRTPPPRAYRDARVQYSSAATPSLTAAPPLRWALVQTRGRRPRSLCAAGSKLRSHSICDKGGRQGRRRGWFEGGWAGN